jgi:flagellar hook assembly protein FlgD
MLKELHLDRSQLQIGFNRITWDGRDEDGDEIANGYYFYKILMKTGSETMETLQKLAKLR